MRLGATVFLFTSAHAHNCASPGGPRMPPDQDDDAAPELPWVERRPIARLAAFGDKTEKPVITAKALREQKAIIIGKPEWPKNPTEQQKKYMGNIAKDFSVEWNDRQRPPRAPLIKYSRTITTRRRTPPSKNSC